MWSTLSAPAERTEPSWIQISWHRDSAQLHTVGPCRRVSSQREKRLIQWKQVNVFECSWNYECLVSTRSDTCGWFTETPEGHIQVFYPQKTGEVMKCSNKLKSRSRQQNEAALLSPLWVSCSEFSCRFITLTCCIMLIGLIMCCYTKSNPNVVSLLLWDDCFYPITPSILSLSQDICAEQTGW